MALIEAVKNICDRLASKGWRELLLQHGLDITASNLKQELTKELPNIDRSLPGFEDFAFEGKRGIEAGKPAHSLLFHALTSPNVTRGAHGEPLGAFPTLAELEIIENYVWGIESPSLAELRTRAGRAPWAIVVFATEYRPAPETVHRKHADLCFSRTGVARVGTAEPLYDDRNRGFLPDVEGNPHAFRVLPARYSAYIAVRQRGAEGKFGPMRVQEGDETRGFWVPLHKLFSGTECIYGLDLHLNLQTHHVNEKLRRVHLVLRDRGQDTGWQEPDLGNPPFIFSEGIAELADNAELGSGLVVPTVHPRIVEPARYQGKLLTFKVSPGSATLSSSLSIPAADGARPAPEYVHVRHQVLPDGGIADLNDDPNVVDRIRQGGYEALHYLDFTGDGWVEAFCPELTASAIPRRVPAYSLVTAPDFFPNTDQRELMDWWEQSVPVTLRNNLWQVPPETLSDERKPPNLQLEGADFRQNDTTVTAIVSLPLEASARQMPLNGAPTTRHAYLPDAAAGIFAPGWDVSFDRTDNIEHLAAYGLGSPFPEDAKLCAALSTFWPAVAPDAARTFEPNSNWPTVSPLTDEEIGQKGSLPWDGVTGPKVRQLDDREVVEYSAIDYVDYVQNALDSKFSLALTGKVDVREYEARVLAMARVYRVLGIAPNRRGEWSLNSFLEAVPTDLELQQAQRETGNRFQGQVYRFQLYRHGRVSTPSDNPRLRWVEILETVTLYLDGAVALVKRGNDNWVRRNV